MNVTPIDAESYVDDAVSLVISSAFTQIWSLVKKELLVYFSTPLAYMITIVFLVMSSVFTFYLGNFFIRGQADLLPFFNFHPWLYLFFIPALSMGLWSQERQLGTIELLLTLPLHSWVAVLAKFIATWLLVGIALSLTFPIWVTVNYLGQADNGVIVASYIGSWFLAGVFLAIGCCMSVLTRYQIIAFILTVTCCFFLMVSHFPMVQDAIIWAPQSIIDFVASLSLLRHFEALSKGVLALKDLIYFFIMIISWLIATVLLLEIKKAE